MKIYNPREITSPLRQLVAQGVLSFDGYRYRLTEAIASHSSINQLEQKFLVTVLKYFEDLKNHAPAQASVESKTLEYLKNKAKTLGIITALDCCKNLEELISLGIVQFDGQRYKLRKNLTPLVNASSLPAAFLPKLLAYFEGLKENNHRDFSRKKKDREALPVETKTCQDEKTNPIPEPLQQLVGLGVVEFSDNRYKLPRNIRKITSQNPLFPSALAATLSYFISQVPKQPKSFLSQEIKTIKIIIYEGKKAGLKDLVKQLQKVVEEKSATSSIQSKLPSPKSEKSVDNILVLWKTLGSGLVGVLFGYFLLLPQRQPCKLTDEPVIPPAPTSKALTPDTLTVAPKENVNIPLPQPSNTPKTSPTIKLSFQVRNKQNNPPKPQHKSAPVSQAKPPSTLQNPALKQVPAEPKPQQKSAPVVPNTALEQELTEEINPDILHLY
jgi:hypothetical protein